jgi:hypothetical protein
VDLDDLLAFVGEFHAGAAGFPRVALLIAQQAEQRRQLVERKILRPRQQPPDQLFFLAQPATAPPMIFAMVYFLLMNVWCCY